MNIQKHLESQVAECEVIVAKYGHSEKECDLWSALSTAAFKCLEDGDDKPYVQLELDAPIGIYACINSRDLIKRLNESLALDLIHVASHYLITEVKSLVSPAGFHSSDRVFIKSDINLCVDNLNNVPSCNTELFAHDINKIAA